MMRFLKEFFLLKRFRKYIDRKSKIKSLKGIFDCIELGLNKEEFDKVTNRIILEKLKEKNPDNYKERYLENIEKIERIKETMYNQYSKILKNVYESLKKRN